MGQIYVVFIFLYLFSHFPRCYQFCFAHAQWLISNRVEQVTSLQSSALSGAHRWCYIMDPSFVLFSAAKRVTLREEDMTVEKISKIFQVWPSNIACSHTVSLPKIRNVS